jgi:ankyrin repeat protein
MSREIFSPKPQAMPRLAESAGVSVRIGLTKFFAFIIIFSSLIVHKEGKMKNRFIIIFIFLFYCLIFISGADGDDSSDAFFKMIDDNDLPGIQAALQRGFALNEIYERNGMKGETPLLHAVRRAKPDIVKIFLDFGADVNFRSEISWTPLIMAVSVYVSDDDFFRRNKFTANDAGEILNTLIACGADINATAMNMTLLIAALIGYGDERVLVVAKKLLLLGADPDPEPGRRGSAIFSAIGRRGSSNVKIALVRLLLSHGANANAQFDDGSTSLHDLASHGAAYRAHEAYSERTDIEIAKLLLKGGADPRIKDAKGRTPMDIAKQFNNGALYKLLRDYVQ